MHSVHGRHLGPHGRCEGHPADLRVSPRSQFSLLSPSRSAVFFEDYHPEPAAFDSSGHNDFNKLRRKPIGPPLFVRVPHDDPSGTWRFTPFLFFSRSLGQPNASPYHTGSASLEQERISSCLTHGSASSFHSSNPAHVHEKLDVCQGSPYGLLTAEPPFSSLDLSNIKKLTNSAHLSGRLRSLLSAPGRICCKTQSLSATR